MLIIQHSEQFLTVYAHTSQILVKEQQLVERGQKIAEIGTSDTEKPMLHFQIRKSGGPLDPKQLLPGLSLLARDWRLVGERGGEMVVCRRVHGGAVIAGDD